MSRIDVTKNEDGQHQVLVNMGMTSCNVYKDLVVANHEAVILQEKHYPHYELHLLKG